MRFEAVRFFQVRQANAPSHLTFHVRRIKNDNFQRDSHEIGPPKSATWTDERFCIESGRHLHRNGSGIIPQESPTHSQTRRQGSARSSSPEIREWNG